MRSVSSRVIPTPVARGQKVLVRAGLAALLALGPGGAPAADSAAIEAEIRALRADIIRTIGGAPCANLVHCRLLELGTRPCGGPDEYLAYSSITGNKNQLENKAVEYGLLQEDLYQAKGGMGTCVVLPPPRLVCVDNRCRTE